MDVKVTKSVTTVKKYEFETDDIEEIIKKHYGITGDVQFKWDIGQWVSLSAVLKNEEVLP